MSDYGTCKKCGKNAVHLALTAGNLEFFGDSDDLTGNKSEYDGAEIKADVSIGIHVCFACGDIVDVFIEYPREKVGCE